jgi:hypothetical protein
VLRECCSRPIFVTSMKPGDGRVRVALKRREMLGRAPPDARDSHAKLAILHVDSQGDQGDLGGQPSP